MSAMSEIHADLTYALEMAAEAQSESVRAYWWREARNIEESSK